MITGPHFKHVVHLKHILANETASICDKFWRLFKGTGTIETHKAKIIQQTENYWHHPAQITVEISGLHSQQNL